MDTCKASPPCAVARDVCNSPCSWTTSRSNGTDATSPQREPLSAFSSCLLVWTVYHIPDMDTVLSPVCSLSWVIRCTRWVKELPHHLHAYSLIFEWVSLCFRRLPPCENLFSHVSHLNGFTPVWVLLCFLRSSSHWNTLLHNLHLYSPFKWIILAANLNRRALFFLLSSPILIPFSPVYFDLPFPWQRWFTKFLQLT